jgi:hypothetical protein
MDQRMSMEQMVRNGHNTTRITHSSSSGTNPKLENINRLVTEEMASGSFPADLMTFFSFHPRFQLAPLHILMNGKRISLPTL